MNAPRGVLSVAEQAAARDLLQRILDRACRGCIAGAAAGLALAAAARLGQAYLPEGTPDAVAIALAAIALGVIGGVLAAWVGRRSPLQVARAIEQRLGLNTALTSAIVLARSPGSNDPAFVDLAIRAGDAAARRIDPRRVMPVRLPRSARWVVPAVLAALAGAWLIPSLPRTSPQRQAGADVSTPSSEALQAVRQAERALEEAREAGVDAQRQAEVIDRLEEELRSGDRAPEEARAVAAAALQDAAEELTERAQRSAQSLERLRQEAARRLADGVDDADVERLLERLAAGDFASAAEAADALSRRIEEMDPDQRARTLEDLRRLAEAAESAQRQARTPPDAQREPPAGQRSDPEQSPQRSPDSTGAPDRPEPEEPQPPNRPPTAPDQPDRPPSPPGGEDQTDPETPRPPPSGGSPDEPSQPQRQRQPDQPPSQVREPPGQSRPQDPKTPGEPGQPQGEPDEQRGGEGSQGRPAGEGTPSREPSEQPSAEPGRQAQAERPGAERGDAQPQPVAAPSGAPSERGDEQRPAPAGGEPASGDPARRISRTLRELEHAQEEARRMERVGSALRDRARDLLSPDGAVPGLDDRPGEAAPERPTAEEWAVDQRFAGASGDAGLSGRAVGEWLDQGRPDPDAEPLPARIQRAQRAAQRSIEQQAIPRRYADYLRRVFERYAQRAGGGG